MLIRGSYRQVGLPKTPGYCWPTSFKVLGVLFLGEVSPAFLPSKMACWAHQLRYLGVGQQYPPVTGTLPHVYGYPITICTETRSICSAQIIPACGRLLDSMRTGGPGSRIWTRGRSCLWPSVIAVCSCTMGRQRRFERLGGSHPDEKAVELRHNAELNRRNEFLVRVPALLGRR